MEELYSKVHLNFGQKILKIFKVPKKFSTTEPTCPHLRLKENGQQNLKQNNTNKKFVYLISPDKIVNKVFFTDLAQVLRSKKVSFFQLRLKKETNKNKFILDTSKFTPTTSSKTFTFTSKNKKFLDTTIQISFIQKLRIVGVTQNPNNNSERLEVTKGSSSDIVIKDIDPKKYLMRFIT